MKRDMDLVREILFAIEASESGYAPDELKIDGHSYEEVAYHVFIMMEGGLVEGSVLTHLGSSSPEGMASRLTWSGHEFLDASRSPTIWAQTKATVNKVGGASMATWIQVLTCKAAENLGF